MPLDVSAQAKLFNETLLNIFSNFIHHKAIKWKFKEPPWMSKEIKTSMRKKNRLYKKYVSNGCNRCNADDVTSLNNQSIYCADLISSAKFNHYKKLASKLNDPLLGAKAYWSILNGFVGKAKIPMIPLLFVNNNIIFNNIFANQCTVLNNDSELTFASDCRINDILIQQDNVIKIIRDLNPAKAHGYDGISIRMIKMCAVSIVVPLMIIFNKALATSVYPDIWKRRNVVPVHLKDSKNLVKHYRPICLLPVFGKIFEKILNNVLFEHLKFLVNCQSGFLPGDLCISQLLSITHDISKEFDGNPSLEARVVFLYISKALCVSV